MARRVLLLAALPALAAAALALPADKPKPKAEPQAAARTETSIIDRLGRRVNFPGVEDPKTTLREALDHLADLSGLSFDINDAAFREDGVADVASHQIAEKPIPKMKNAPVGRVLRKLLARVPAEGGAVFMVRREAVEITTTKAQAAEVWPKDYEGPHLPLVSATFDGTPLDEALKELARQSGMNVVVDARVVERAKVPVSARFLNAPLDTAVRVLADMAELKPFPVDNLLYVTARDNADRLEQQQRPAPDEPEAAPRLGNGPGHRPPPEQAGM
jgi:hypothetical protein